MNFNPSRRLKKPLRNRQQKKSATTVQQPATLQIENLEDRLMLSTVQIIAAGVEGSENMQLQIAGSTVRNWTVGGDAYGGQFQTYTHTTTGTVTADQVRIQFTNDLFDQANNIDRNLRIDAIVIDGQRFETEAPTVYSTGTWKPADGVVAGFRQSEYLHANGYFQFAGGGNNGSTIKIAARGSEGGERFNLLINGANVFSATTTTANQVFAYNANSTVTPDQIRVQFTNDLYDPANNIDRNLIVNYVEIGSTRYQTEAPNVFSTGTWLPADGVQPGFRQSEWLHTDGYFQYGSSTGNAGSIALASSVYTANENGGSVTVSVVRSGGTSGAVGLDFTTINATAIAGQDYVARSGRLTWANGEGGAKTVTISILDDSLIEGDETFNFTIDNLSGNAQLLAPRTATVTIDDNDSTASNGDGLLGEYFDNVNLTNRFLYRIDPTVNFNWTTNAPVAGMGADTFSVRWTGKIEPRFNETYTFSTNSDDGVRLWVNNQLVINQWNDHAPTIHSGTIALSAGVKYDIKLEYYENTGGAVAQLRWQSASQALQVIPKSQLYAADPPPVGDDLVTQTVLSGLPNPTSIRFTPDGQNMYVSLKEGKVLTVVNGVQQAQPFIDISSMVNGVRDRGLLDIEVHPDFANNPYVYLLFTYDPPQVNSNTGLAGPDGIGNRAGRLIRVTANAATGYRTAIPGSEVVLLGKNSTWNNFNAFVNSTNNFSEKPAGINPDGTNVQDFIASDSESHTVGSLAFGTDGNLFVSIGDGTSYNAMDPRTVRVQDIDNLSGKVLRIDPITGKGVADNPFFNGNADANRSKVYQLGLRNPFRMTVDPVSGQLYIGDVGWTQWEEVNAGGAGANFGWPYYEGGTGVSLRTNQYQNLPQAQTFYASGQTATPAIYGLNHSQTGINAIVLGDVYTGTTYPAKYRGDLFFNDLGQGIVRNISFNANGSVANVETFTTGAQIVVDIKQGPDGNLYFVDLNDGKIGRWVFQ